MRTTATAVPILFSLFREQHYLKELLTVPALRSTDQPHNMGVYNHKKATISKLTYFATISLPLNSILEGTQRNRGQKNNSKQGLRGYIPLL